jgi:hypothetical protein
MKTSEETKPKEYILCSAIHVKDDKNYAHQPKNINSGFVICGRRHCNCFVILSIVGEKIKNKEVLQGFLTNTNCFVDRKTAAILAYNAKQIKKYDKECELFSEDLY